MIIREEIIINTENQVWEIMYRTDWSTYIYYIKTNNLYAHIGKLYCKTLEKINRVDYINVSKNAIVRCISVSDYIRLKEKSLIEHGWVKHSDFYAKDIRK